MITGALAIAKGVWTRVNKILAGIGRWLQDDHDWWRIGCFSLALACTCAAFVAYDAKRTIVVVKAEHAVERAQWSGERALLQANERTAKDALTAITDTLNAKAAEVAAIRAQNAHLAAENARLAAAAEKSYAAYMKEYANRQPECTAALRVLAQTCPTLKGY